MTFLRTFRWMLAILAAITILVSVGAWWFWLRSDEMIRTGIIEHFAKIAPDWDLNCRSTRFDGSQRVHCYSVTLKPRGHQEQLLRIPELIVTVDRNRLLFEQQVDIQRIVFNHPEIQLTRAPNGRWNWQDLAPPEKKGNEKPSPEIRINSATVNVRVEKKEQHQQPVQVAIHNIDLEMIPDAMQLYDMTGSARLPDESTVDMEGWVDVQKKTWRLGGSLERLLADGSLLDLAMSTPELQTALQKYGLFKPGQINQKQDPIVVAALPDAMKLQQGPVQLRGTPMEQLGLSGTIGVEFDVRRVETEQAPTFRLGINVEQGQIDNPALPFPLRNVNGKFFWEKDRLIVENCSAQNGRTRLNVNASVIAKRPGEQTVAPDGLPEYVRFQVENLHLEDRLRDVLTPVMRRQYDAIQPEGDLDAVGMVTKDASGKWVPHGMRVRVRNGRANPLKFKYQAENITGNITQRDAQPVLDIDLNGIAGGQPVQIIGTIQNPGPNAETKIRIAASGIPLDRTFREALDEKSRKVVDSLRLTGLCDASVVLYRPPGPGQKLQPTIDANITRGQMQYVKFPWMISDIEGHVHFDPVKKEWSFDELTGVHGDTIVAAVGSFQKLQEPGKLSLQFHIENAAFDKDLRYALTDDLKRVWSEISPTGRFDLKMNLDWIAEPSRRPLVRIGGMQIPSQLAEQRGYQSPTIRLRGFPWTVSDVKARLSYDPQREPQVEVTSFSGRHDNVRLLSKVSFDQLPDNGWRVGLREFEAVNVIADSDLLTALPTSLRSMLQSLRPTNPFHIRKSNLAFGQARAGAQLQSQWNTSIDLTGGNLTPGVSLQNVRGRVSANGSYDGVRLRNNGQVQLATASYLGNQVRNVRGPYEVTDQMVVIGSAAALGKNRASVPMQRRLIADAYGGRLTLDGVVPLDGRRRYQILSVLKNAQLQQWSRKHNLSGVTNGWISLTGVGSNQRTMSGQGQITVSPAQLYELPIMLQVIDNLSRFRGSRGSAFDTATARFKVANRQFQFEPIHLTGESLSLKGKGTVGFDGQVALNFYSTQARRQANIISQLVQEAARGWVGVYVRGNVNNPTTRVETGVPMNDFLRSFAPPRQSGLSIPNLFVPQASRGNSSKR